MQSKKDIKYGMTGWVELTKQKARKYMPLDEMYWIKEYTTLLYLWEYNHSNIIRYESGSYIMASHPNKSIRDMYFEIAFRNYGETLVKTIVYTDKDVLQIMIDLFSAISLCHDLNIWHRDIKLSNIVITKSMRAVLIDFTHAIRIRTDNLELDTQVATYSHRAPEVFEYKIGKCQLYNEKIDIFALGIILYEIVTNSTLYANIRDHSEEEIKSFYLNQTEAQYIAEIRKLYFRGKRTLFWSKDYWTWIEKMIARNPNDRPDAKTMLNTMIDFAAEKNIKIEIPVWFDVDKKNSTDNKENNKNSINTNKDTENNTNSNIENIDNKTSIELDEITLTEVQIDLVDCAIVEAKKYIKACPLSCRIKVLIPIIEYLIHEKTITKNNYREMTFALCICIDTVIYDHITEIKDSISQISKVLDYNFQPNNITEMVITLMQMHEHALFLDDRFEF